MTAPLPAVQPTLGQVFHDAACGPNARWDLVTPERAANWEAGAAAVAAVFKPALEIAYDLAEDAADKAGVRYDRFPPDSPLGKRLIRANADVATVRAAIERVTAAMGVAG